jgi:hypothetical protein
MRLVPDPLLAAGEPLESADDAALCVDGGAVTVVVLWLIEVLTTGLGLGEALALGLEETLTLRLGDKLAIALWTALPHPAVRHPMRIAARRQRPWV